MLKDFFEFTCNVVTRIHQHIKKFGYVEGCCVFGFAPLSSCRLWACGGMCIVERESLFAVASVCFAFSGRKRRVLQGHDADSEQQLLVFSSCTPHGREGELLGTAQQDGSGPFLGQIFQFS